MVFLANRQFYPLAAVIIFWSLCRHGDDSFVYVSPSCLCALFGYLSSKHKNGGSRCFVLCRVYTTPLPPCLSWQQCKVNRMNKTYLNQSPPPWQMSSCQYSLMGKHKAGSQGSVWHTAPTQGTHCVVLICRTFWSIWFARCEWQLSKHLLGATELHVSYTDRKHFHMMQVKQNGLHSLYVFYSACRPWNTTI